MMYSLVASVIAFLASRVEAFPERIGVANGELVGRLHDTDVKNSWGVLPRTPVWDWLNVLQAPEKERVQERLRTRFTGGAGKAAFTYVSLKQDLAGHAIPESTVAGAQASVFEFRSVPNQLRPFLFSQEHAEAPTPEAPTGHKVWQLTNQLEAAAEQHAAAAVPRSVPLRGNTVLEKGRELAAAAASSQSDDESKWDD